jgi:hypothetical protein
MEVYSRSTSRRNRSFRAESIANGLEPSLSDQFAAALEKAENDPRQPLLQDSGRFDLESAEKPQAADDSSKLQTTPSSKDSGLHDDDHVQGSSFLQALFNGMNILAGTSSISHPWNMLRVHAKVDTCETCYTQVIGAHLSPIPRQ